MKPVLVKDDIYWLGVHDPRCKTFEAVLAAPWGTTYNAYLIKAEKPTLVETVKVNFREEFLEKLRSLIDPLQIQYVIMNHTEADHSGTVPWVAEVAPNARFVASKAASSHLHHLFHLDKEVTGVGDGDTLDLGDRELSFVSAPYLHWPDTMFTYSRRDLVLFTCDAFAVHYCDEDAVFDDEAGDFKEAFKYYYDNIMRPFKHKVREAVDKIEDLEVEILCTGHGPVLRTDPRKYVDLYRTWSEEPDSRPKAPLVAVLYSGESGNVAQMSDQIARGLTVSGVTPVMRDVSALGGEEAGVLLKTAAGLLAGISTLAEEGLGPVAEVIENMTRGNVSGKPAAVFGPFGTTGEAVRRVEDRLKEAGAEIVKPAFAVEFAPDEEVFQRCREFGLEFAAAVKGS